MIQTDGAEWISFCLAAYNSSAGNHDMVFGRWKMQLQAAYEAEFSDCFR